VQQLNTAPNDLLASALHLADLGISVIPLWWPDDDICACSLGANCESPAKHPIAKLVPNGLTNATTNAVTIEQWWQRYPKANIGLCTGGEIDVIDVDGAIPAYQELIADIGAPQFVAMVLTGRGDGGLHIYCTPGGNKTIPSGKHGLPNKIEVKGAGGYVVAPPSKHVTGGTYTYLTKITGEIHGDLELSQWLAKLYVPVVQAATVTPIRQPMHDIPATADNVTKYRDAVIESARSCVLNAGEGGRWMGLATEAVPKIARGIAGGLIEHHVGVYALETAARESGLSSNEVARIPEMIDIMLAQGIKQPIMPPQDTEWAVNSWLGQLPKDQAGDLPADYMEVVNQKTSWSIKDIGPVLRGEVKETPPEFLEFTDDEPLFYAGKVNGIIGESESGKTWIALEAVKQALGCDKRVLYMDFEDTDHGIISRLRSLGVSDFDNFAYMSPDEGFGTLAKIDLSEALTEFAPHMAILDGFNAAMNVLGLDINSNNDATTFAQLLLKPVAATGVCLVYVDHVPKSKDARGKGGIGAQAKRAMTTGCTVSVTVMEPFGRGNIGKLAISVDKDRAGHVRGYCVDSKNLGTVVLTSDKDSGNIEVDFDRFDGIAIAQNRLDKHKTNVTAVMAERNEPMTQFEILEELKAKKESFGNRHQSGVFHALALDGLIRRVKVDKLNKWELNLMAADDDNDDE
jgi:hypothetical protein